MAGETQVALHVEIDRPAEIARVTKEIDRHATEIAKAQANLENESFLARAKPGVVDQFRKRVDDLTATMTRLRDQRARLESSS